MRFSTEPDNFHCLRLRVRPARLDACRAEKGRNTVYLDGSLSASGSAFFLGLPGGRKVLCKRSRAAVSACQAGPPKGRPRRADSGREASSFAVCGSFTQVSQSLPPFDWPLTHQAALLRRALLPTPQGLS